MEEVRPSRTALYTAYFRGYHSLNDTPKVFDDYLAWALLTGEERVSIEEAFLNGLRSRDPVRAASFPDRGAALRAIMQRMSSVPIVLARSRYAEDLLMHAVGSGVRQYIILGAGMDSFVYRHPWLMDSLHVFEVDHPAMQSFKRSRLAALGWGVPPFLQYVPVDFNRTSLAEALASTPYDPAAPTFYSWLGVTYYLSPAAVLATLRDVARISPSGTSIVFDYLNTEAFIEEKAAPRVHYMLQRVGEMGEPMQAGFDPLTLASEIAPLGLRLQENLGPVAIHQRYFTGRTDDYHAAEHAHFAYAVVR